MSMSIPSPAPSPVPGMPAVAGLPAVGTDAKAADPAGFLAMIEQALGVVPGTPTVPGLAAPPVSQVDSEVTEDATPEAAEPVDPRGAADVATALAAALSTGVVPAVPVGVTTPVAPAPPSATALGPSLAAAPTALASPPITAKPDLPAAPAALQDDAPSPATDTPAAQVAGPLLSSPPLPSTPAIAAPLPAAAPAAVTEPAPAVRAQVFEKVDALVSRGPGTHRLTLTLRPEHLGEVRVVMTVRDGAVQVRLAAGEHEARAALREGVPDLHRLLQATGATDTRVVVRELAPTAPAASSESDLSAFTQTGTDRSPQHQQHAGTRADQPATDGDPTTPRPARPRDQVTSMPTATPAGGLDVSM
ncbi:MAG: flagellar hook-length control protein FliK [Nocardioidaceae bacterium]|nr:flagellar hook-length control protein FliK [Nocardioidaceae bacterium]